jgi:ribosomal protein S7
MNSVMYDGKKSAAEGIVYGALDIIEAKTKQGPLPVFQQALDNVMPTVEVRRAASAAPPIRCRSKCAPSAARRSAFAGSSPPRASATKRP